jgi:hypothetical protein
MKKKENVNEGNRVYGYGVSFESNVDRSNFSRYFEHPWFLFESEKQRDLYFSHAIKDYYVAYNTNCDCVKFTLIDKTPEQQIAWCEKTFE